MRRLLVNISFGNMQVSILYNCSGQFIQTLALYLKSGTRPRNIKCFSPIIFLYKNALLRIILEKNGIMTLPLITFTRINYKAF